MLVPDWLQTLALISLILAGLSALLIAIDLLSGHQRKMWIMNVVWPLTALYAGPLAIWAYFTVGRKSQKSSGRKETGQSRTETKKGENKIRKPFWQSVGVGALHCGSGCTLGDLIAESLLLLIPVTLFGSKLYGGWLIDYIFAFCIGIVFQYYAIKPMKNLSPRAAFVAALKADTLSLTAWQLGMYGWMAISTFLIFGRTLEATEPIFWFMMQIAMMLGFVTAYPVNWWLIRSGIKEAR